MRTIIDISKVRPSPTFEKSQVRCPLIIIEIIITIITIMVSPRMVWCVHSLPGFFFFASNLLEILRQENFVIRRPGTTFFSMSFHSNVEKIYLKDLKVKQYEDLKSLMLKENLGKTTIENYVLCRNWGSWRLLVRITV